MSTKSITHLVLTSDERMEVRATYETACMDVGVEQSVDIAYQALESHGHARTLDDLGATHDVIVWLMS